MIFEIETQLVYNARGFVLFRYYINFKYKFDVSSSNNFENSFLFYNYNYFFIQDEIKTGKYRHFYLDKIKDKKKTKMLSR